MCLAYAARWSLPNQDAFLLHSMSCAQRRRTIDRAAGSVIMALVVIAKARWRVFDKSLPNTGLNRKWLIRRNTEGRPPATNVSRVLHAKSLGDFVGVGTLVRDEIVVLQKLEKGMNIRPLQPHKLSQITGVWGISLMV